MHAALARRPGPHDMCEPVLLDLGEDYRQCEQREGLDEGQAEDQQQLDTGASAWVTSQCFGGRGDCLALTETAKPCSQPHAEADADRRHVDHCRAALCKGRNGKAESRQSDEYILKFPHSSPASFEINRQWVVEAHRAGPLTLAVVRLSGVEALSGGIFFLAFGEGRCPEALVFVRGCLGEINHRQEHEDVGLNERNQKVQAKEGRG